MGIGQLAIGVVPEQDIVDRAPTTAGKLYNLLDRAILLGVPDDDALPELKGGMRPNHPVVVIEVLKELEEE